MTWFAWHGYNSGKAVDIAGTQEKQAALLGFHGYKTEKQAEAHPNSVADWFPDPALATAQKEFVNAIIQDFKYAKKAGEQPGGPNANILNPENDVKGLVQASGIGGIFGVFDAVFRQLTKTSMWRSLGWIVLGCGFTGGGIYWWARSEGETQIKRVARGDIGRPNAPIIPLSLMGIGIYLIWFGVKYFEDLDVIWPSDPIKSVLITGSLPGRTQDVPASALLSVGEQEATSQSSDSGGSGSPDVGSNGGGGPGPANLKPTQEQAYAFSLFQKYGWGADQEEPLVKLWNQESGWRWNAKNPKSGAYGIPQSLPASKMASAGSDYLTDWKTQIRWGLQYIHDTYGSPSGAWDHETAHNWY